LVREERKLADGTLLVRYQFGNGPPRFAKRQNGGRAGGPGYAYHAERFSRFGRPDWMLR
jgi:hypothetical protein